MVMPPWAANAYDLTRVMRTELESKYVRDNLHKWIDLIFGNDQGNPDKLNLFFSFAYSENHKDQNKIDQVFADDRDPVFSKSLMVQQMSDYFIVPTKLFDCSLEQKIQKLLKKMDSKKT